MTDKEYSDEEVAMNLINAQHGAGFFQNLSEESQSEVMEHTLENMRIDKEIGVIARKVAESKFPDLFNGTYESQLRSSEGEMSEQEIANFVEEKQLEALDQVCEWMEDFMKPIMVFTMKEVLNALEATGGVKAENPDDEDEVVGAMLVNHGYENTLQLIRQMIHESETTEVGEEDIL